MKIKDILSEKRTIINICFIVVLALVGFLLNSRIKNLLYEFVENQVSHQASALADKASEMFGAELAELEFTAQLIREDEEHADKLIKAVSEQKEHAQFGLLAVDGSAVYGNSFSPADYKGIQDSFRGNHAVSYRAGDGLMFSCPVFRGDNIHYVLCEYYGKADVHERFGMSCFDDAGKLFIVSRDGEAVLSLDADQQETEGFCALREIQDIYSGIRKNMELSVSAAKRASVQQGTYFFYEADISSTDLILAGYVDEESASKGAYSIVILVGRVFGLIALLFVTGSFYLILTSAKLKESDELKKAKIVAEEASKAKSDFLASMSHEIRTPINAVLGMDEMILREYDDPTLRQYAINIRNAGNTLLSLVNEILDLSKIEAGKMKLIPTEYDMSILIYDLVTMIKPRAEKKGLKFSVDVNEKMPHILFGDNVRLKQCIINILTNAVKYTEKGSVRLSVDYKNNGDGTIALTVRVTDTGIGIKEEDIEKLFSPFERIEEIRTREIEGTGLGMSIVKKILALMDTRLVVKSKYSQGSDFSFTVVQEVRSWKPIGNFEKTYEKTVVKEEKYHERFTAPRSRILIVDDIEMNLTVMTGLLKKTMINIDTALGGKEALALTEKHEYDVLFIDDRMPGMDGMQMLKELRGRKNNPNSEKPCIVITANAVAGAKEKYIKAGFEDYLSKPIDAQKLESTLLYYLPEEKVSAAGADNASEQEDSEDDQTLRRVKDYCKDDDELYDAVKLLMKRKGN